MHRRIALKVALDFVAREFSPEEIRKQVNDATHMDKVDPELAKYIVETGLQDGERNDDRIAVKRVSVPAPSLKPSQTTMRIEQAVGMALGMLESRKIGGDLGAIISSDGYIMDGHHRWAAAILAGGKSAKVGGFAANLKAPDLIRVLNILSKGAFGVGRGKPGSGNLNDFTPQKVKSLLEDYVTNGIRGKHSKSPDQVRKTLEGAFGSVEVAIDTMAKNVGLMNKSTPSGAPPRNQMPVIDHPEAAVSIMQSGKVNWQPPFDTEED